MASSCPEEVLLSLWGTDLWEKNPAQLSRPSPVHPIPQREPQQPAASSMEHLCTGMGSHTDPDALLYSQVPSVGQSCMEYPVPWVKSWKPFDTTFWLGQLFSTDSAPSLGPWGTSSFDPQLGRESPTFPDFLSPLKGSSDSGALIPGRGIKLSLPSAVHPRPQRDPQQLAAASLGIHEHLPCMGMGTHTDPEPLPYSQGPSVSQSSMGYPVPWVNPWTPFDTTFWLGQLFSTDSAPSLGPWGTSGFDPKLGGESPTFPDFLSPLKGSSDSGALIPGRGIKLSLPSAVHPRPQRDPQQLAAASLGIHEHLPCMGMGTHTDPEPLPYSQGPSVGQSCTGYPVPWVNPWTLFDTTFWLGHLFSTDSAPSFGPWGTSGFDPQLGGESSTFPDFPSLLEPLRPSSSVPPGFSSRPPCPSSSVPPGFSPRPPRPNPSVPPVFPLRPPQPRASLYAPLVPSDSPPRPLCPSSVVPPDLITRTPRSGRTPGRLPLQAGKARQLQANSSLTICQALPAELTSKYSMLASMGPSSPELLSMPPSPITDGKADVCRPRARRAARPPCKARRRLFDP